MKDILKKYKKLLEQALEQLKTPGERKKQIPNILTTSRLLAPFIIIPSVATGNFVLAGISTLVFSSTDLVDGFLARKMKITSELGKTLDAVSDKVFVGTLITSLLFINPVYFIPLTLEGTIAGINIYKDIKDKNPESHMTGKIKMTSLYLLLAMSFMNLYVEVPQILINSLFVGTTGLQIFTICDYTKNSNNKEENNIIEDEMIENKIVEEDNDIKEKVKQKEYQQTLKQDHLKKYRCYKELLEEQQKQNIKREMQRNNESIKVNIRK